MAKDVLQPAFDSNNVAIAFAANEYFVPYMATMIYSIVQHASPARNYDIVVLHRDITAASERTLREMVAPHANVALRLVDVSAMVEGYSFYLGNREHACDESYFRLLIPEVFKAYEKVLYLDGDMVALTDVAELYDTDLGSYLLASSRDLVGLMSYYNPSTGTRRHRDEVLCLKNSDDYFISGMLLFNIPVFRATYTCDYLLEFATSQEWMERVVASRGWMLRDQDVLNVLCEGRVKLVSASWDVFKFGSCRYLPPQRRKEFEESVADPKIIHFGGDLKPWVYLDVPFSEHFWRCAAQTPFIREIITRRIYLDKPPVSVHKAMAEEVRQGRVGARYLVRLIGMWLARKLHRGEKR